MHRRSDCETGASFADQILWAWLLTGAACLLVFPSLRGQHAMLGWLPFWYVLAPAIDLAILRRRRLAEMLIRTVRVLFTSRLTARRQQAVRRYAKRAATWRRRRPTQSRHRAFAVPGRLVRFGFLRSREPVQRMN